MKFDEMDHTKLKELASKGGKASAEAKKEYKTFREKLQAILTEDVQEEILASVVNQAKAGDLRAFVILRETAEGKLTQAVNVKEDRQTIEEYLQQIDDGWDYDGQQ